MDKKTKYVDGELYLSLEVIAEVYQVQTLWLHDAYQLGLLGRGLGSGEEACIAAVQLDRIASVVRLHKVLKLDLEEIQFDYATKLKLTYE